MKAVIVGAGEVGFHIAGRFASENKEVVVIDKSPEAIRRISDHIDVQVLAKSGSSPKTLEEAGIREAEMLFAVTDSDETNLVACLVCDILSPTTRKFARIRSRDYDEYDSALKVNAPHIDTLINPDVEVVRTIDRLMKVPGAVDVNEFADGRVKFIGVHLKRDAPLSGIRLIDLPKSFEKAHPLIAAIMRNEEMIIPRGNDRLMAGDLIYFVCEADGLSETMKLFGKQARAVNRVLIIGGGSIGLRLARHLENQSIHAKLIEKSSERCAELAQVLDKVIVLNGDGSDQALLKEENIKDMDLVVSLTNDEETNIISSLLAKRLGAKKAITKINKFSYFPLMTAIGIELVVSPRLSAINTILKHIRKGKVLSAASIKGEEAEIMEAVALETADIVGKPLSKIRIPKGALVTGIIRNDTIIIPTGSSVIEPGDRIIIFAKEQAIEKVEKILTVKLEYH